MKEQDGRDGQDCEMTLEMIRAAAMAGANSEAARQGGFGAGGFEKLARKHSARAATLAREFLTEAAIALMSATASDFEGLPLRE